MWLTKITIFSKEYKLIEMILCVKRLIIIKFNKYLSYHNLWLANNVKKITNII